MCEQKHKNFPIWKNAINEIQNEISNVKILFEILCFILDLVK